MPVPTEHVQTGFQPHPYACSNATCITPPELQATYTVLGFDIVYRYCNCEDQNSTSDHGTSIYMSDLLTRSRRRTKYLEELLDFLLNCLSSRAFLQSTFFSHLATLPFPTRFPRLLIVVLGIRIRLFIVFAFLLTSFHLLWFNGV